MRPNDVLAARVTQLSDAVGWRAVGGGASVAAVHVRRGDRMELRRLVPCREYIAAAADAVRVHRLRAVLLSTDDAAVARAFADAALPGGVLEGVSVLADPMEARNNVENSALMNSTHSTDMLAYALTAAANAHLMSRCAVFVGTLHTHFGRMAYELSLAGGWATSAAVSLDLPWSAV